MISDVNDVAMTGPVAVLGGTGHLGFALAQRWAQAGCEVIIGSRDAGRAQAAASPLGARGMSNLEAAQQAQIAVLAVPFASQAAVLEEVREALQGKVLIDATVPLVPPKVMRVQMPPEGSAALKAAGILGEGVRVVSAFHNVPADALLGDGAVDCDVLVFGDDKAARQAAIALAELAGLKGLHGGALANSVSAEALTSVLIFLNKQYGGHAGIRLTGLAS